MRKEKRTLADVDYESAFDKLYGWTTTQNPKTAKKLLSELYRRGERPTEPELMYCLGFALYEGVIPYDNGKAEGMAWLKMVKDQCSLLDPLYSMTAAALRHIQKETHEELAETVSKIYRKLTDEMQPQMEDTHEMTKHVVNILEDFTLSVNEVNTKMLTKIQEQGASIEAILQYADQKYDALVFPTEIRDKYESELSILFGKDWRNEKRLCPMTCDRLVAARVLLHYSAESNLCDYRGVIISATSALEYELYRRFCEGYITYLYASNLSENRKAEIKATRFDRNFTMGSLMYYLQESDKIAGVVRSRPEDELRILNTYLETYVMSEKALEIKTTKGYKHAGHVYIGQPGETENIFSVKVRQIQKEYRDKAAHKEIIDHKIAAECCREIGIVSAESSVQTVESVLKDLLTLTKPFEMPQ